MHLLNNLKIRSLSLFVVVLLSATAVFSQQNVGSIRGEVKDEFGGVIVGATVKAIAEDGTEKTATTDASGVYVINNLKPGTYTLVVEAKSFSPGSQTGIEVVAGKRQEVSLAMTVEIAKEEVNVNPDAQLSTSPDDNKSALVLKPEDLEGLPEDPDELAAALLALAGPSAGPNGGQINIDGFAGGRMPPREAIREIRINQNPFSAEFDRVGFGRVDILTRPGFDRFRGSANFNFNDESLNSRNPFADSKASHQNRNYGFNIGGPIKKNKSSFFFDFNRREADDNTLINAIVLDPALNEVRYNQTVLLPNRSLNFSPRIDYAINSKHTLVGRYSYNRRSNENQGLSLFTLPSLGYITSGTDQNVQLTETAVLSDTVVNETRFQYSKSRDSREGDNSIPTLNVSSAFSTGGAQVGKSFSESSRWELNNTSTWIHKTHTFKFGSRIRSVSILDHSESNFAGTVQFFGYPTLTSIDQYRGRVTGNTSALYLPSQFSITLGEPDSRVKQFEFGGFFLDDWRVRPNLTLSAGLRYENQNNIESNLNFAPRLSVAWSPGGGGSRVAKTVIRGGVGVFYNRIGENTSLQTIRFDGTRQTQYVLRSDLQNENAPVNVLLRQLQFTSSGAVTNIPTAAQLAPFTSTTSVVRILQEGAQAPYTMQAVASIERQLPHNITATATYSFARNLHLLRQRNINAPFIVGYQPSGTPITLFRGNPLYEYDTSGYSKQQFLSIGVNARINPKFSMFANYTFGKIQTNAEGFPEYTYDLSNEFGRASFDTRHRINVFSSITLPWGVSLNPFVIASSGSPFNIIIGQDRNGDLQTTERPALATALTNPANLRVTQWGNFDINPAPGAISIPRNYGQGPGSVTVNLRIGKSFGFGTVGGRNNAQNQQGGNNQSGNNRGGNNRGGGGGGGNRGGGGGGVTVMGGGGGMMQVGGGGGGNEKRFNLNVGISINNLFNTNNKSNPVGNLSSPFFGQSLSTGGGGFGGFGGGGVFFGGGGASNGNRRIDLSLRFSF